MKLLKGFAAILVAAIAAAMLSGIIGGILVPLGMHYPGIAKYVVLGQTVIGWTLFFVLSYSFLGAVGVVQRGVVDDYDRSGLRTRECQECGRINALSTKICPKCETRQYNVEARRIAEH